MKDIEETRVMVDRIKLELPKLPEGALRCTSSNGTSQYWVDCKYTSKKKISYVKALAQRDYYEKVLPLLENNMEKLQELDNLIMKNKIEECYNNCCSARQILIDPVVYSSKMLEKKFMNQVYEPGTF